MRHEISEYQVVEESYTLSLVGEDGERKPYKLHKGDIAFGYKREGEDFLALIAVEDENGKTATRVYEPLKGAADLVYFQATGRKTIYLYDDTCDGIEIPCDIARVDIPKYHAHSGWIKVDKDHQPKPYQRVVGLWEEQSLICYLSREGDWCDELHRCYCYTAPKYFAYLPEEFNEEK